MAKTTGEGGGDSATTLIFPTGDAWNEMLRSKQSAKTKASSANGTYSKVLTRLVKDQHMDRKAAGIIATLDAIEDPEDLHVTVHHLIDGLKKTGLLERAMAVPDLFDNPDADAVEKVAAAGAKAARAKQNGDGKKKPDGKGADVVKIGTAARAVVEKAGEESPPKTH